ncbi:hypothetical protein PSTG_14653 [Puccinia striiformis f. sp. tritici PST-78]|uniref:Uncharacterized protein n=1 Tax=Puccinia striiformis f. sp. tritici PST-78 TaxID=1165861 RepID=A0A0L0UY42_9BASI|nr:hypothetical protein PSTG_14653 [Puccinia striiformis f. sp. tritici PST-78]
MHSRSLSLSLLTLVSLASVISLPLEQEYQSGAQPTDQKAEMPPAITGSTQPGTFPSGQLASSAMGPNSEIGPGQLEIGLGRPASDKNPKIGGSIPGYAHPAEKSSQAVQTNPAVGHPNHSASPHITFQSTPSHDKSVSAAERDAFGLPALGPTPSMPYENPSGSPSATPKFGKAHQNPSPGYTGFAQNSAQGSPDNEKHVGEVRGNNKSPQRRTLLAPSATPAKELISRDIGARMLLDSHAALERRQEEGEMFGPNGMGAEGQELGPPYNDLDGSQSGLDGDIDGGFESDMQNNQGDMGLRRRTLIERPSTRRGRRHNGEDHTNAGHMQSKDGMDGPEDGSLVKQTATNATLNANLNATDLAGQKSAQHGNLKMLPDTQASQKDSLDEESGVPSGRTKSNTQAPNSQPDGMLSPNSMGEAPADSGPPASFTPQFQPQRFSPQQDASEMNPSRNSGPINPSQQMDQGGLQQQNMGTSANANGPNGVNTQQGAPFGMQAGSRNANGPQMDAEIEEPSGEDAGDDEEEDSEEALDAELAQSLSKPAPSKSMPSNSMPNMSMPSDMHMSQPLPANAPQSPNSSPQRDFMAGGSDSQDASTSAPEKKIPE